MSSGRGVIVEGPDRERERASVQPTGSFREDAHAVVIGIDRYKDPLIPALRCARADAEAMYRVLTDPARGRFKTENVTMLLDEEATERRIRSAIGTQLPRRTSEDHTVCIFYAGHGAPMIDPKSKSADGMEKFLVPHDADAEDLRASAISMETIQEWFSLIPARQLLLFLDSCYSGGAGGRSFTLPGVKTRALLTEEFLDSLASEGRFVVTACGTNEVSLETIELGHGLFTHYLVKGLQGDADTDQDGLVSIDELYQFIYANVSRESRLLGGQMRPMRKGSVTGAVYLTQYETTAQRRAKEVNIEAAAALSRGDLDEASRLWQEVLGLSPKNDSATRGLAEIAERRERVRAELERKHRKLLELRASEKLSGKEYNTAWLLLVSDTQTLSGTDRSIRRLVDDLVNGDVDSINYQRSVRLLLGAPPIVDPSVSSTSPPIESSSSETPKPGVAPQPVTEEQHQEVPISPERSKQDARPEYALESSSEQQYQKGSALRRRWQRVFSVSLALISILFLSYAAALFVYFRDDLRESVLRIGAVIEKPDAFVVQNVSRGPVIVYVKTLSNGHRDACGFAPFLLGPGQSQTFGPSADRSLRDPDPNGTLNTECNRAIGKPFDYTEVCVEPCTSSRQRYVMGRRARDQVDPWFNLKLASIGMVSGLLFFVIRRKNRISAAKR